MNNRDNIRRILGPETLRNLQMINVCISWVHKLVPNAPPPRVSVTTSDLGVCYLAAMCEVGRVEVLFACRNMREFQGKKLDYIHLNGT